MTLAPDTADTATAITTDAEARVLPRTARRDRRGFLSLGNVPLPRLALQYGTPLYLFDDEHLRSGIWRMRRAFSQRMPAPATTSISYAAKAFLCLAVAQMVAEEGVGMDVNSGGELHIALKGGVAPARIHLHGNALPTDELRAAVAAGVGRVVVDNLPTLHALDATAGSLGKRQAIWLRLNPSVRAHTHAHITTGHLDSKFGVAIETGQAAEAVRAALAAPHLDLVGIHAHIGSGIADSEPYRETTRRLVRFAAQMRGETGWTAAEISTGGGFAVRYLPDDEIIEPEDAAEAIIGTLVAECAAASFPVPHLGIEPGKALVAPAAVALYSVLNVKDVPGARRFVAVDGGMADNIRPALYDAKYTVLLGNRVSTAESVVSTVAGRYCESGDLLARDVPLPADIAAGDLLVFPAAGAYAIPMSSQYNGVPRPAIALVREDGTHQLLRRRETYDDLLRHDVPLEEAGD